jgi:hypothetical protein
MTTIILIGIASAFTLLLIVVKAHTGKPNKLDRQEKAEILKRILALSERENMVEGALRQKSALQTSAPRRRAAAG